MHESVTISHRGSSYEIGSGLGFYGIWLTATPAGVPGDRSPGSAEPSAQPLVEWWPQTPEGWHRAWSRFAVIEAGNTIVPVGRLDVAPGPTAARPITGAQRFIAPALLAVGIAFGIAGLFPGYLGSPSLASAPAELTPHLIYLAAWAASAALLLWRGASWRPAAGALVAVGTSAVTFGLFFADLGTVIANSSQLFGAGLLLSLLGWLACAAGSVAAVTIVRPGSPRRLWGRDSVLAFALTAFAALGAAIAFAPSWDSYTLRTPGQVLQTVTEGNSFANPGPVIVGDVAVMAVLFAVVVIAALWQPIKLGAALLIGATVPLIAQAVSAVVQIQTAVSPQQFGIPPAQAARAGLTISSGLTPAYWVYGAFVLALVLIGLRMITSPASEPGPPSAPVSPVNAGAGVASELGRTP